MCVANTTEAGRRSHSIIFQHSSENGGEIVPRAGDARTETNTNMGLGVGTQCTLPYCVMSWPRDVYRSHSPRCNADGLVFGKKESFSSVIFGRVDGMG